MGIIGTTIGIIAVTKLIDVVSETNEEKRIREEQENKRKSTVCNYSYGTSKAEFEEIVELESVKIKRIKKIYTKGVVVYGIVESNSGITDWDFSIDFNDWGKLTGWYRVCSDNNDSPIPSALAKRISSKIRCNYEAFMEEQREKQEIEEKKRQEEELRKKEEREKQKREHREKQKIEAQIKREQRLQKAEEVKEQVLKITSDVGNKMMEIGYEGQKNGEIAMKKFSEASKETFRNISNKAGDAVDKIHIPENVQVRR